VDPHTNAQPFADYKAKQLSWRNVFYNDETSGLIQQAGQEMDNAKRIALYQKANRIMSIPTPTPSPLPITRPSNYPGATRTTMT
jgi:peptide/nickel transport system substrate-binding protein